ncbi:MAG: DUF4861 family protein [Mangrovimonas sp.]|nr:DUF4861 family protein [Mangrovimonas sp.]HRV56181.1 DUF4861 family protein [Mangrovimonas sp.]
MKHVLKLSMLMLLGFVSCKQEKGKEEPMVIDETQVKPYAEISIKEGGDWQDGPRDHKEYIGGTFKNVQEMTVPSEHTDHSWYIRYEGPGWENKNIGYRLYLDWRNAIDIYGKKVDTLVLPYVGQDGFDSYHEMSPWGQDILKAGKSLGIGGYGRLVNDTVKHFERVEKTAASVFNTDTVSGVRIDYKGWQTANDTIDLKTTLRIFSEDRYTKAELNVSKAVDGICTGIVKFDSIPLIQKEGIHWAYIATYGTQTLVNDDDKLGMAVFYKLSEVKEVKEGGYDHLVVFNPATTYSYYFLGAWEQELGGLKNEADFTAYLEGLLQKLDTKGTLN